MVEKPKPGEVEVRVAGTKAEPLIELEFFPEKGEPVGIRMQPEAAMFVGAALVEALVEIGWMEPAEPLATIQ